MGRKKTSSSDRPEHSEVIYFRCSPELKAIIEKQAELNSLTVSHHIRCALILDAMLAGNADAVKMVFNSATTVFKDEFRAVFNKNFASKVAAE